MTPLPAYLPPTRELHSRRQEHLSQNARDLLAWAFRQGAPAYGPLPLSLKAVEVPIGPDDVRRITKGGFILHSGAIALRNFAHADDPTWAMVCANDCDGCPERGAALVERLAGEATS